MFATQKTFLIDYYIYYKLKCTHCKNI